MGWNEIYARGEQMNRWPWTDLVSAVKRNCGSVEKWQVLELGCGQSMPNWGFFDTEGALYTGIDGVTGHDFTKSIPEGPFDLICDRAAVTHNSTEDIRNTLRMAHDALRPGGWYIGIDWFSTEHDDYGRGEHVDERTFKNIPTGQFTDCGLVHFSNAEDLRSYFQAFEIVDMRHKRHTWPDRVFAAWDIVCRKQ